MKDCRNRKSSRRPRKLSRAMQRHLDKVAAAYQASDEYRLWQLGRLNVEHAARALAHGIVGTFADAMKAVGGDTELSVRVLVAERLLIEGSGEVQQLGARVELKTGKRSRVFHGHPQQVSVDCTGLAFLLGRTFGAERRVPSWPPIVSEADCVGAGLRIKPVRKSIADVRLR